jgi:hypothetical protein
MPNAAGRRPNERSRQRWWAGALVLLGATSAYGFEGTLKLRTVSIERTALAQLAGKADPSVEDIFSIALEKIIAFKEGPAAKVEASTVYISGSKLRADTPVGDGQTGYVIVDVSRGTTEIVVPAEHRYIEWTAADADAMRKELAKAQAALEKQLAAMPPEQRKQTEAAMRQLGGLPSATPQTRAELQPLGQTRGINGFHTLGYQIRVGDEVTRGWVTQDQPDLARLYQTAQESVQGMLPAPNRDPRTMIGQRGLPVLVQTVAAERYRVEELVAVDTTPVSADLFTTPSGFKRSDALEGTPHAPP